MSAVDLDRQPEHERIAQLDEELQSARKELKEKSDSYVRLQQAYRGALEELRLLKRSLFVSKAERAPTHADQLVMEALLEKIEAASKALDDASSSAVDDTSDPKVKTDPKKARPLGRRNLEDSASDLPKVRVEILDPEMEGKFERIDFDLSYRLGYERGGMRRIEVAVAVYKDTTRPTVGAAHSLVTAPMPRELFSRGLLAPSMVAHILVQKYMMAVPFYRLEKKFEQEGASLDRGTMCRYAEDAGGTLGAIVLAMRDDAMKSFCLSTDATGVSIQPEPAKDKSRQPCRKGHFFVVLADQDHVFFEYHAKQTGAVVSEMFRGYAGYIQADAHIVYEAMFQGRPARGSTSPPSDPPPKEVGCWAHARRKFWEAAVCKHPLGLEGLQRINTLFAIEKTFSQHPPVKRKLLREKLLRPHIEAFFAWVKQEFATGRERGLVRSALGYAFRQEGVLRRFLEDGKLVMTNNASERALRAIAVGRKNWLFFGSDDHASAAANLYSLIGSCRLHDIEPEAYLTEVIRVMPFWPRDRYLELAPKNWAGTRSQLVAKELADQIGHITVPPATKE